MFEIRGNNHCGGGIFQHYQPESMLKNYSSTVIISSYFEHWIAYAHNPIELELWSEEILVTYDCGFPQIFRKIQIQWVSKKKYHRSHLNFITTTIHKLLSILAKREASCVGIWFLAKKKSDWLKLNNAQLFLIIHLWIVVVSITLINQRLKSFSNQ